jgi:hypothetical protein
MGKTKFFLSTLPFGSFSHMTACKSSLENTTKMNLIPVLNKTPPWAHTELELDKHVVHSSKRKNRKKMFFFTQAAQTAIHQFLASRNFRD